MENSDNMKEAFRASLECATNLRNEYYCPEHLLYAFLLQPAFQGALLSFSVEPDDMREELLAWLQQQDHLPESSGDEEQKPVMSVQMTELISSACHHTFFASREQADVPHFTYAMLGLEESWAAYMLKKYLKDNVPEFMSHLISFYDIEAEDFENSLPTDDDVFDGSHRLGDEELYVDDDGEEDDSLNGKIKQQAWRQLVTCVNDLVDQHNPLIGREQELELKAWMGKAIELVPGKSEEYLLLGFEDNCRLWLRSDNTEPIAYIEANIFGNEAHFGYDAFTAEVTMTFHEVLGIPPENIYINYADIPDWGAGGRNFDRNRFR